jgi:putative membrane protein
MTGMPLLNALLFASLGVAVFVVALAIAIRLSPLDFWKQIVTERNTAVAIFAAAVALGLAWIIAAAMH